MTITAIVTDGGANKQNPFDAVQETSITRIGKQSSEWKTANQPLYIPPEQIEGQEEIGRFYLNGEWVGPSWHFKEGTELKLESVEEPDISDEIIWSGHDSKDRLTKKGQQALKAYQYDIAKGYKFRVI